MNRFDPANQDTFELHAFCIVEDDIRWFDHGTPCERPQFHVGE